MGSEIVVADNGRGFVPPDESEPHTALKNIRQRLEFMCGGTMDISPGDDGGTVVTITIPDDPISDHGMLFHPSQICQY